MPLVLVETIETMNSSNPNAAAEAVDDSDGSVKALWQTIVDESKQVPAGKVIRFTVSLGNSGRLLSSACVSLSFSGC